MISTDLTSKWRFKPIDSREYPRGHTRKLDWMPATVPGCVHTDLLAYGVICDPFSAKHEAGLAWVDEKDWIYECDFEWKPSEILPRRTLRFEGLDTVAAISLNGKEIGSSDNFFVPVEVDVTKLLIEGANTLTVRFLSAVTEGERRRREFFSKNSLNWQIANFAEHAFVRKPGYMSGWDWGPRLVSAGVWGPVKLVEYDARILDFTVFQERLTDGRFRIRTETRVEGGSPLTVRFGTHQADADLDIIIDDPKLWWPNGYGSQHLYTATAELAAGHRIEKKVGLRDIKLLRKKDGRGESFCFEVNGERIWSGGANWIPNDSFPSRITPDQYREQIQVCKLLNFNMLRVWGGGLYESEEFYDACDREGILVWQDFAYACSYYPDQGKAAEVALVEAEHHVRRLRDRTCLALWCGNNENLTMWQEKWGGPEQSPPRYFGEHIYNEVLPQLLNRLDPHRPYIPSSPCGAADDDGAGFASRGGAGDQHYWDVWHGRGDWKYYAEATGRFASEFGFASSCSRALWDQTLLPGTPRKADDPTVRFHDKTMKPFEVYRGCVELHYPPSADLDEWIYTTQLNQRDALRFGIEHYRSCGFCDGALIWQLNDCWPVESWAVQDYLRLLKPAAYELRRLFAQNAICLKPEATGWRVRVINHGPMSDPAPLEILAHSTETGEKVFAEDISIGPDGALLDSGLFGSRPAAVKLRLKGAPESERWFLTCEPKDATFCRAAVKAFGDTDIRLEIQGLAFDFVVSDADDPSNLPVDASGLKGVQAFCVADGAIDLSFEKHPERLAIRQLKSISVIAVDSDEVSRRGSAAVEAGK